jgi:predicted esterase
MARYIKFRNGFSREPHYNHFGPMATIEGRPCPLHPRHSVHRLFYSRLYLLFFAVISIAIGCKTRAATPIVEYQVDARHSRLFPDCSYTAYRDLLACDEGSILYYLHGSGGDVTTWLEANRGIIDAWREWGISAPIVVAISFGPDWRLFPEGISGKDISVESFVRDLIPEIETSLGAKALHRFLYGFSIGGSNAAQLLFRYPSYFERAALAAPALYTFSPYSPVAIVDDLVRSVNVRRTSVFDFFKRIIGRDSTRLAIEDELSIGRGYVRDPESWNKADILGNIKPPPSGRKIMVYISDGIQDRNGFYPGSAALADKAAALGYDVTFDSLEGGHMTLRPERIASFLAVQ